MAKRTVPVKKTLPNTSAPTDSAKVSAPPAAPAVGDAVMPAAAQATTTMGETAPPLGVSGESEGMPLPEIMIAAIEVCSAVEGFRRAGRIWSRQPVIVPLAELTDAQLLQIEAEPLLSVVYLSDPAEITAK